MGGTPAASGRECPAVGTERDTIDAVVESRESSDQLVRLEIPDSDLTRLLGFSAGRSQNRSVGRKRQAFDDSRIISQSDVPAGQRVVPIVPLEPSPILLVGAGYLLLEQLEETIMLWLSHSF